MRITVLVDNNTESALQAEWGLSLFIEYNGHRILLDAGTTGIFAENAKVLGIAAEDIEFAVLSHAHYDHADGFARFFEENKTAKCYIRSCCGEDCYDRKKDKYIGIKPGLLKEHADRFVRIDGDRELLPGAALLPHKTEGLGRVGEKVGMYRYLDGAWVPDDFSHEQSLVFQTKKGLVICNSCCHGGADRIIEEVKRTYPGERIHALIGGLHLYRASDEEVTALAEKIRKTGIEKVYTGHCTGERAMELLTERLNGCKPADSAEEEAAGRGDGQNVSEERRPDPVVEQIYTGMEIVL